MERDWGPELSQHPVKTAIGKNLLSEAIHGAKKTAQALYAVQLEDFRTRSETRTWYAVAGYERGRITKAAGVPEEMERRMAHRNPGVWAAAFSRSITANLWDTELATWCPRDPKTKSIFVQ